jgi:hypothetical protein
MNYLNKSCDLVNEVAAHKVCTMYELLPIHELLIEFWPTGVAGES